MLYFLAQSQINNPKSGSSEVEEQKNEILLTYPAPPSTGHMNITYADFKRLNEGMFLNDASTNFYLNRVPDAPSEPMEQQHTAEDITRNSEAQSQMNNPKSGSCEVVVQKNEILLTYPAPPSTGRMNITYADFKRLNEGMFLNDASTDFCLNRVPDAPSEPMEQQHTGEDITRNCEAQSQMNNPKSGSCEVEVQKNEILLTYPAPPSTGRMNITYADFKRLNEGMFLNDASTNFYLNRVPDAPSEPMEQQHTDEDITRNSEAQSQMNNPKSGSCEVKDQKNEILLTYPAPPSIGRMNITYADFKCLNEGKFLNDAIIDFYLKYFFDTELTDSDQKRTQIFSSYFYSRLTQKTKPNIPVTKIERYDRVKKWTRNIDLFSKDFIIVPIYHESHWFLAVICHPSRVPDAPSEPKEQEHTAMDIKRNGDDQSQMNSGFCEVEEQRNERPCICIYDSYKNYFEKEFFFTNLQEYLELEWERKKGTKKVFNKITMPEFDMQCPQQPNTYDCGIYLLQFVESFFKNPIPFCDLEKDHSCWFPQETMTAKRQQLKALILELRKEQEAAIASRLNQSSSENSQQG
ncbi:hypothetical protein JTE90_011049 [Oedothorax gibbosus]|uniref:Ubiquitin-like protease family profile domain-containing protein n=1 Tax=Oedothorax gibbosus TaxID=931172 RepID=A0AAV6VCT2_9ARAC|nr:hypothetical protein JTE90_011049 [Oedothorax gibbosus]